MPLPDSPHRPNSSPNKRTCAKGLGNWIRLPGRHHKRDYWSEVWDGSRWIAGHDAVEFMLALPGDDPALVPEVPPMPPSPPRRTYRIYTGGNNLASCIVAYMHRLPHLGEGQGRDDVTFNFAAWLVRDMDIDDDIALAWLERWDSGNNPPKGRARLAAILKSAHDYGTCPYGCGRRPEGPRYDRHRHRILSVRVEVAQ
jgi:hypothetical protein